MHRALHIRHIPALAACVVTLLGLSVAIFDARSEESPGSLTVVSNVAQLRRIADEGSIVPHTFQIEGDVWWANSAQGRFVLHDATGAVALELESSGMFPQSGQRLRLTGTTTVTRHGFALCLGSKGALVDNNGVHGMIEKSGTVYLKAGYQAIRLEWFNGEEGFGLALEYEGPGIPRQTIPKTALVQLPTEPAVPQSPSGLKVHYYETTGNVLPNFSALIPIKTGIAHDFNLVDLPRRENVAAVFSGAITIVREGLYTFHLKSDDGSRLFVGEPPIQLIPTGTTTSPKPRRITVGQLVNEQSDSAWVEVEGKVTRARVTETGLQLELRAGAGHMSVEIGDVSGLSAAALMNSRIRAVGYCQNAQTTDGQNVAGVLLVPSRREIELIEPASDSSHSTSLETNTAGLPMLTTAADVHGLKREEAQREYPVKIRGMVTCVLPEHQGFTIEDATRGLYVVDLSSRRSHPPEIGDYLEVEGTTDPGLFAPYVNARRVTSLGAGRLPQPVKPTWDQLINGSLDAQQVELHGIVTAIHTNGLTLLMRGGVVKMELRLAGQNRLELPPVLNALVRIQGCLFASWDYVTHQVKMGDVRIYAADILVDQAAPQDLFSSPRKTAGELLQFDPRAGVFQRVKVSGQIIHKRDVEYFLMDGARGLRFTTKQPATLETGDMVDVVGFPDLLGNASPVLREAVVRKTGHATLPAAETLRDDNLIHGDHDAKRVTVEGMLVGVRQSKSVTMLEMQNGVRTYVAYLKNADDSVQSLAAGSRLELTGVYAGLGGNRAAGLEISAFELLMTSPADIRVMARPAWWTLKRLLVIVGALACVLAAAALWITQLHRQVEERTAQLGAQIQERQRVEHQRAMETERTRIAQDLHDELGSGITEIGMLAARAKVATAPDGKRGNYLDQVGSTARELVTALDEIVWAMNPRHDSLASLVSYFCLYADRFLGLANIAWRLENPTAAPDQVVDSRRRHQLFLVFKEALTNVVRHSGATEVRLNIHCENQELHMSIADNGRGLPSEIRTEDMDGVVNMRSRIEKLGGRFEISGSAGRGTTVRFNVPSHIKS